MIRRRAVAGLALLSALLFCALAAQSASAAKAINTTTFTCVEKPSGGFSDAHCDNTASPGTFGHVAIANDTTTEVDATNEKVTESTKNSEPAVLKGNIGGAKVEIECTTVKGDPKNSLQHNVEPVAKQHTFTGSAEAIFSKCSVKLVKNCTISEPIVAKGTFEGVEGLEGPKGEKNAMGVEYRGAGGGETFAEIEFTGGSCSIKGAKYAIAGSVIGTSGPTTESGQESKGSGATIVITPKFKMQSLKLGSNAAEMSLIIVPLMAGGGNPISITTTT